MEISNGGESAGDKLIPKSDNNQTTTAIHQCVAYNDEYCTFLFSRRLESIGHGIA